MAKNENQERLKCGNENCTFCFGKIEYGIYRKKFLLTICVFSLICIGVFGYLIYYHHCQMNAIVQVHKEYIESQRILVNDNQKAKGTNVNQELVLHMETEARTIERILQMQTTQQHSFFTILSIWAGVLMIVFLVFSLYSMFKTDELMRQAKESIIAIEDSKNDAEKKLQEVDIKVAGEIDRIKETTTQFIENIKKELQGEQKVVSESIKSRGEEFAATYKEYEKQLKEAQQTLNNILQGVQAVVNAVHNTGTSEIIDGEIKKTTNKSQKK